MGVLPARQPGSNESVRVTITCTEPEPSTTSSHNHRRVRHATRRSRTIRPTTSSSRSTHNYLPLRGRRSRIHRHARHPPTSKSLHKRDHLRPQTRERWQEPIECDPAVSVEANLRQCVVEGRTGNNSRRTCILSTQRSNAGAVFVSSASSSQRQRRIPRSAGHRQNPSRDRTVDRALRARRDSNPNLLIRSSKMVVRRCAPECVAVDSGWSVVHLRPLMSGCVCRRCRQTCRQDSPVLKLSCSGR